MYSKSKGITDRNGYLTPPPGYDGSRFRRRSDGRDDSFPLYPEETRRAPQKRPVRGKFPQAPAEPRDKGKESTPPDEGTKNDCESCSSPVQADEKTTQREKDGAESGIISFLRGIGNEELLLIALIILMASSPSHTETETILILALLLCIS